MGRERLRPPCRVAIYLIGNSEVKIAVRCLMLGKKWSCPGSQLSSLAGWSFLGRTWTLFQAEVDSEGVSETVGSLHSLQLNGKFFLEGGTECHISLPTTDTNIQIYIIKAVVLLLYALHFRATNTLISVQLSTDGCSCQFNAYRNLQFGMW